MVYGCGGEETSGIQPGCLDVSGDAYNTMSRHV